MITAKVSHCNNVVSADIQLKKNHLNICYAMNGTGKSTIAKAINIHSKDKDLSILRAFDSDIEPTCSLSKDVKNVLLFDDDFVNEIIFQESEVIQNSFEVFIKTPEYEERKQSIDRRLKNLQVDLSQNTDIQHIITVGNAVLTKFTLTKGGAFKQQGLIKSLTSSENVFKLPEKLSQFQPLMDKKYNVEWVGWKHDGSQYDDIGICPFCTASLDDEYDSEKQLFNSSYTKSNVKNIREMLAFFDDVTEFMDEKKKDKLYQCIKEHKDEQEIELWVKRFYLELSFLVDRITKVEEFDSYQVRSKDISRLEEQLKRLVIDISDLEIFNNKRVIDLVKFVNNKINTVLSETDLLKREIGQLNGLISTAKQNAVKDINDFLSTAGIPYEFEIIDESENTSKTILRYISRTKAPIDVSDIRMHLSWGEKNAFALVLFMHFALSQNPDIVILDDPISSFDSNKKYAILNRLFTTKKNSFHKKTVLMLTHDLQPIIDRLINRKPHGEFVSAHFLQNEAGVIKEQEISTADIKSLPILLADNSGNESLNRIHRVASLRKLLEHTPNDDVQNSAYNILSCLLHGKTSPAFKDGRALTDAEIRTGKEHIKQYIADFDYDNYLRNVFSKEHLLKSFNEEKNSYFRLQIFRVLVEILNIRSHIQDDSLMKYIDEQLHVENDYIFTLDFRKYDIVPDFVIPKCIEFLRNEGLIS